MTPAATPVSTAANLRPVHRRPPILTSLAIALTGALLGAGCATFSDNDAVARVGDVELSADELRERVDELGAPQDEALDANAVRQTIDTWISEQLSGAPDPALAAAVYPQGLLAAGSICFEVIVAESAERAAEALDQLQAGASFGEVFAAHNIDPALTQDEGRFGCVPGNQIPVGTGNTFVDALTEIDDRNRFNTAEIEGNPGEPSVFAVVRFIPFDELGPEDTPTVFANMTVAARGIDVYVDPRYGTFDSASGTVVALG